MRKPFSSAQQRRGVRANLRTLARSASNQSQIFTVHNLSAGGALLVGPSRLRLGQPLELYVSIEEQLLYVTGVVIRLETRQRIPCAAIRFVDLPADVEDALQNAVVKQLVQRRAHADKVVVIVDEPGPDAQRLARRVAELGLRAVMVRTCLDALRPLQDPELEVRALLADADVDQGQGAALLAWCAEAQPEVLRVLTGSSNALSAPRAAFVSATLTKPVSSLELAHVLGEAPARARLAEPASLPFHPSEPG